ncbi:Scarecrow-like protein 14 [Morella rubra]|uniref:Scarecrow-like protein 14 n=1 Tax=Morella rubra TaxID=262757 RepID=A0A6A1V593_9ROSI|nr:Scarecrow-like protein 14 [Morella rubra]
MNAIACEGLERVERPETYKQWQVRNLRAGFRQLPLDQDILRQVKKTVKSDYNKDFVVDGWQLDAAGMEGAYYLRSFFLETYVEVLKTNAHPEFGFGSLFRFGMYKDCCLICSCSHHN